MGIVLENSAHKLTNIASRYADMKDTIWIKLGEFGKSINYSTFMEDQPVSRYVGMIIDKGKCKDFEKDKGGKICEEFRNKCYNAIARKPDIQRNGQVTEDYLKYKQTSPTK
jgi:hypothetical protein